MFFQVVPFKKEVKIVVLFEDLFVYLIAISNTPGSSKNAFKIDYKESK